MDQLDPVGRKPHQVVQSHCQQKLDAAASQLETVWLEVVQQASWLPGLVQLTQQVK